MKKLIVASIALAAWVGSPAMAADLAVKAPLYKAPPPIAVFSWTGCYFGGNVGGLWVRKDFSISAIPGRPPGTPLGGHDADSFFGGVQAGCNYQAGNWVFGVQADYGWADAVGSHADTFFIGFIDRSRTDSLGSVTGRVGYAWGRFLGYVKGGGAWEHDRYYALLAATGATVASATETRGGWTVGIGGEYAFTDNLSGFVEYDYYDFGTRAVTAVSPTGFAFGDVDIRERKSVVKAGLNWKFGWGPVVARY
jgi:outer membrane immunogenic protein